MPNTPARTPYCYVQQLSAYVQKSIGRLGFFGAAVTLFVAVALLGGCNATSGGLSSDLPPGGGGGILNFASVSMPDGIAGRTYSKVAVTSVEAQSTTHYPISPSIISGTAPVASCSLTAGALPPGFSSTLTIDSTGSGCVISGTPAAAAAGKTYQFTIQAQDSNSPPRAATQQFVLKIRPEFTVTAPPAVVGNILPAGVAGRTYGQITANAAAMTATTTLSATTGNGAVGAKNYCAISVTPALATLALNQVAGTNNCILQDTGALSAGGYKVSVAVTDTAIADPETALQAVPANTITAVTNGTLNVGAPLHLAANPDAVSAAPPNAVQGRVYGTGAGCSGGACLPLTYVSSGGLPSVEAGDNYLFSASAPLAAAGITCAAASSSAAAKTTCSGTGAAAGSASFAVTVDDPGNLATPSGSASGTTGSVSALSLTVQPALAMAISSDPAANPAVQSRTYGTGTGCTGPGGACAAPTYTPSGGLGTYAFNITGAAPAGITCAANGGNTAVSCSGAASSTAATSTFSVGVADIANASTPSGVVAPVSKTLTVDNPLTVTAPASVPNAVDLRPFGTGIGCTGGNCAPATFPVSGGVGTYSANATVTSAPGTWTCSLSGLNYNCSSASVSGATGPLSITTSDTGNAATPGATTPTAASVTVNVASQMTLVPPVSIPDAVTGRAFGTGAGCTSGACSAIQYAVTGGLQNYTAGTMAIQGDGADTIGCSVASSIYSCSIGTINGATASNAVVTVTANETGNASTPGGTAQDHTRSMNIQPKVTLAVSPDPASNPAVQSRTYGIGGGCSGTGGACAAPTYTPSGGLTTGYTFGLAGSTPAGVNCSPNGGNTAFLCSGTTSSTAATSNFTVTASDLGNASTPSATASATTASISKTLTVDTPLLATLTQATNGTNPTNLLDGVVGRSYGMIGAPPTYTATGGLAAGAPGNYEWCVSSGSLPGGFGGISANCGAPTTGATVTLTTNAASGAGANAFTVRLDDVGNATTPGSLASTTSASNVTNLLLHPALSATLTQNGVPNPAALLDGVINRSYGTINAGAGAPTYTGAGGISGAAGSNYEWCATFTSGGSAPGGFTGISQNCAAPTTGTTTVTLTAPSAVTGFANTFILAVKLDDLGNAATPGSVAAAATATNSASLLIHPQLAITVAPSTIPDAVNGRTYGTPSAGTDLVYSVQPFNSISAGLGTVTMSPQGPAGGAGFPAPIACTQTSSTPPTLACNTANNPVTSAAATFHPTATATDTANAATPAAIAQSQLPMTVDAPLQATLTQIGNGTTNPANLLDGVIGRTYGVIGGTPTYTATGGLGAASYQWCISAGTLPGSFVGVSTNCAAPTIAANATLTANPVNTTATAYAFTVRLDDGGNATTPGSAASSTSSSNSTNVLLHPALSATLVQNNVNNPPALLDGVVNRSYGLTGVLGTPTYTAGGGLPTSYEWCQANAPLGFNTLSACPAYTVESTAVLTSPVLAGPAANIASVRVQVDDTGNAAVPSSIASSTSGVNSASLLVHPQIAIAVAPTTIPDAVTGRTYGTPGATSDLVYTVPAVGLIPAGLGTVTMNPQGSGPSATAGFPAPVVCNGTSSTPPTLTCNSGGANVIATAGSSAAVTASDVANAATPAATLGSDPNSQLALPFNVDPALAITTTILPNGLLNYPYPTVSAGATLAAAGGLPGGDTWVGPGAGPVGACASSPTGAFPTSATPTLFALDSTTGSITGTPTAATHPLPGQFAFQVCVTDTANATTPAGFALPSTANTDPTTLTIDVMTPYAATTETGTKALDLFNTSTLTDTGGVTMQPISFTSGTPYGAAFSTSGRYVYITLSDINKLAVFDTISNLQVTGSPFSLTGCTTPHGVAATSTFIFVACSGSGNVAYLDTTAFGVNTIATDHPTSAPEGVAVSADGSRVYVTLSAENKLFAIKNAAGTLTALSPFDLTDATVGTIPMGIAWAPNGSDTLAYIAEQGASGKPDGIEVVKLTNDTFSVDTQLATNTPAPSFAQSVPYSVAVTPDGARVYATLNAFDEFAVMDNTQSPPVALAGSPFALSGTSPLSPDGVAIPPLAPGNTYQVFVVENASGKLGIINNTATPADNGSPFTLSSGSAPLLIATTPAPQ